jgi:hypothetical protein
VLHDLTLTHAKSSFPTSVGTHIFGVDAGSFASSGEAFSAIFSPHSDRAYERSLQKDPVQMAYSFSSKVGVRATLLIHLQLTHSRMSCLAVPRVHQ